MCSDLNKPMAERYNYGNALRGLYRASVDDGVNVLFRGLSMNVLRSMVLNVSQLAAYDSFKTALLSLGFFEEGPLLHTAASFCAGTAATIACTPVDVVKSRIQNAKGKGLGVSAVIADALKKDGPTVFFRGFLPAWTRLQPQTTLLFLFFEQYKVSHKRFSLSSLFSVT